LEGYVQLPVCSRSAIHFKLMVVLEDVLALMAAIHCVIHRGWILDAQLAGQAEQLGRASVGGNSEDLLALGF
jgi:hypothetical protein